MLGYATGLDNYLFYIGVMLLTSLIGLVTALLLAAVFFREIVVRDLFFVLTFSQLLISGFPYKLPTITGYISDIAEINPLRWSFEALNVRTCFLFIDVLAVY